jgi:hypothetical protein
MYFINQGNMPNWTAIEQAGDKAMVAYYTPSKDLADNLTSRGAKVWDTPHIGGWNTYANVIGLLMARAVAYEILKYDVQVCVNYGACKDGSIAPSLRTRINAFDRTRMVGIMEDVIYSSQKKFYADNLTRLESHGLVNTINGHSLKIGGYEYKYNAASIRANLPWGRQFEVLIKPTLSR